MVGFQLRYLRPVILIALCLVALCAFTAMSLLHQQASLTKILRENIESRRAAVELEECLIDLVALEKDRVEKVAVLHDRVQTLLRAIHTVANQPEERRLKDLMNVSFATYLEHWKSMPMLEAPGHDEARSKATRMLEAEVLKPCQEFGQYNTERIESSADQQERVLKRLAWGMAAVGGLGVVAGVVLGYGVARALAHSIRRLRIQIRDAVGKLGPDLPVIVLTGRGDFNSLHADLDQLTERVERIIGTLHQREREVLRAEQLAAVGQLAAGVAHEIRNPLTSIKMLVQVGLEDAGKLASDDLQVIEGEVRRMERSLQTFLDFARPSKPECRPFELAQLIDGVVGLIRGRADKQRVAVEVKTPLDGLSVVGDAEQIRQVLVNLFLNALDAMPCGGTLDVTARSAAGGAEIEIADTGPGIPDKILPQLFQPFVSTKDTGLGLGLVISRRILENHGGAIWAGNRPGSGAKFVITIPALAGGCEGEGDADSSGG